jgi:hypothetical protein
VTTPITVSPARIIELVKTQGLTILNADINKNYEADSIVTRLSIRLFHKGATDKMAHSIIEALEASSLALKEIKWDRAAL